MVTFIISEARRTGVSFDERMLSSFSVKIIAAILIFPTVVGWVEEKISTKGVGKRKERGGWSNRNCFSHFLPPPPTVHSNTKSNMVGRINYRELVINKKPALLVLTPHLYHTYIS